MFYEGSKRLKNIERAFEIERDSYLRTIEMLKGEVAKYRAAERDHNKTIDDLKDETIKELEIKNENLMVELEQARGEAARLEKELETCGKKLNATQYKEYKRLKRKEYQQRWLKKKAQQLK